MDMFMGVLHMRIKIHCDIVYINMVKLSLRENEHTIFK